MTGSIQTYTGRYVQPLMPQADTIDIFDIAHALAHKCRFTGHTRAFYSVAQHCVLIANRLPVEMGLMGLMHDAGEAYLPDVARPLRGAFPELKAAEERLLKVIFEATGVVEVASYWPVIKEADVRICVTEGRDLLPSLERWTLKAEPYPEKIRPWSPAMAEDRFLEAYRWFKNRQDEQWAGCSRSGPQW